MPGLSVASKAVEHHRTPKRKRNYRVRNGGHVLECGSVLPLLSALSITALSSQSPPWSPKSSSYFSAPRWRPRRFEVEDFAERILNRRPKEVGDFKLNSQKCFFPVDGTVSTAILLTPPEAGPRHRLGWFSPVLGLQIGTQFCPGMINGTRLGPAVAERRGEAVDHRR